MTARAGLSRTGKQSALLRLQDIHDAMHSLLFEVMNGNAPMRDVSYLSHLMYSIKRLEYRVESYRFIAEKPVANPMVQNERKEQSP
jgi:hypothetical protein